MNKTGATGYFARPSGFVRRALTTGVHYVKPDGKCACGYVPHKSLSFQWCADGVNLDYIECSKCRQVVGRAFLLAWHPTRTVRKVSRLNMQKATSCNKGRQFLVPNSKAVFVEVDFSKVEKAVMKEVLYNLVKARSCKKYGKSLCCCERGKK